MASRYFKEIRTPFLLFGIKLFRDEEARLWIKIRSNPRKPLFKSRPSA